MRRSQLLILAIILTAATRAANATSVVNLSEQWAGYWNAKNLNAIMTLYAPDPVFLPTSGERWAGDAAIRKNFAKGLKQFDPRLTMQSVRSETSGNLAYDSGTYEEVVAPTKGGRALRVKGNYLFVFERKNKRSEWKILEQTWTEFDPKKL